MRHFPARLWNVPLGALLLLSPQSGMATGAEPMGGRDILAGAKRAAEIVACYVTREAPAGMAFAVFHGQELVHSNGFGWADLEQQVPVTPATRFRLASVSKLFTAGAIARLSQEGRLDLDAPIRTYVPEFPAKPWPVSVRRIASHLGGIRGYEDKDFTPASNINRRRFASTSEALTIFADDPLLWEPGTGYRYSTFGFTLLAAAVEHVSGKAFGDYLHDDLLASIDVASVVPDDSDRLLPDRGRFYDVKDDGELVPAEPVRSDYKFGGGGLIGTAEDLARYGSAHLRPGFFSEQVLREDIFHPQVRTDGRSTHVGLAWRIGVDPGLGRVFHHSGSLPGARSVLMVWPDQGISLAAMSNTSNAPHNAEDFADALSHVILDAPPARAPDAPLVRLAAELVFEGSENGKGRRLETTLDVVCNGTLETPGHVQDELVRRGYAVPAALNVMGSYRRADGSIAAIVASRLGLHRIQIDPDARAGVAIDLSDKFGWRFASHRFRLQPAQMPMRE